MRRFPAILLALYFLVAGAFLLLAPWSERWKINRFYELWPAIHGVFLTGTFRFAVTLLGAVLILGGLSEAGRWVRGGTASGKGAPALPPGETMPPCGST